MVCLAALMREMVVLLLGSRAVNDDWQLAKPALFCRAKLVWKFQRPVRLFAQWRSKVLVEWCLRSRVGSRWCRYPVASEDSWKEWSTPEYKNFPAIHLNWYSLGHGKCQFSYRNVIDWADNVSERSVFLKRNLTTRHSHSCVSPDWPIHTHSPSPLNLDMVPINFFSTGFAYSGRGSFTPCYSCGRQYA